MEAARLHPPPLSGCYTVINAALNPESCFMTFLDAALIMQVSGGEWQQQGSTLSFHFETPGFERGDVSLPPGRVYVNVPVWGSLLSRDKGEGWVGGN